MCDGTQCLPSTTQKYTHTPWDDCDAHRCCCTIADIISRRPSPFSEPILADPIVCGDKGRGRWGTDMSTRAVSCRRPRPSRIAFRATVDTATAYAPVNSVANRCAPPPHAFRMRSCMPAAGFEFKFLKLGRVICASTHTYWVSSSTEARVSSLRTFGSHSDTMQVPSLGCASSKVGRATLRSAAAATHR